MAKSKLIFLILIVLSKLSFSQKLIDNSIGVVYVLSENNKTYELKIVVPRPFLKEFQLNKPTYEFKLVAGEFAFPDKILLFDESGVFDTLKTQEKWEIKLWCENDGGIQYRPENHLIIEKNSIRRKLIINSELQNICCFALVNPNEEIKKSKSTLSKISDKEIRLKGKYGLNNWVALFVVPDEAYNCDGEPDNNLAIRLYTDGSDFGLRCCGP